MSTVVVIGGSGMLGSMLVDVLSRDEGLRVCASFRTKCPTVEIPGGRWFMFSEGKQLPPGIEIGPDDWIVNAAGMIRHKISHGWRSLREATRANVLLPCQLAEVSERTGARVLQIATDCVFPGKLSANELDRHKALDVYGRTKSLGEIEAPGFHNLRCSIVGPEARQGVSLLEWFLSQPHGAIIQGYTNHLWNGVTTLAFAKVVAGILRDPDLVPPVVQHLVPAGYVTKCTLLSMFAKAFGREDVRIEATETEEPVDRRLETIEPLRNKVLWEAAGYSSLPKIEDMVRELAAWDYAFARKEVAA